MPLSSTSNAPSAVSRRRAAAWLLVLPLSACTCEEVQDFSPQGRFDPVILDLGPVARGTACDAVLTLVNDGGSILDVSAQRLLDQNGEFAIVRAAPLVEPGSAEDVVVAYTAGDDLGTREGVTIELDTDDPDNEGIITGGLTALVVDSAGPIAKAACDDGAGALIDPCPNLEFGPVQISNPASPVGRTLAVTVKNDGNADLEVQLAAINGGNADFVVVGARRGAQEVQLPFTVPPGRTGACGELNPDVDNTLIIDVRYSPTAIGADADELIIATNGLEGSSLTVPLSGVGSDVGIVMTPENVIFGDIAEGETADVEINVQNVGSAQATVNESCIDLEDDGTCDAECTGSADDTALGGTLSCIVTTTDGGVSGKGFVLEATDAVLGGADERIITVTWSPSAGNSSIPATARLILKSNILNNRVFKAPVVGGSIGELEVTDDGACPGAGAACIQAAGDAAAANTWTGEVTLTLRNTGSATLAVTSLELDADAAIVDDYTLETADGTAINLTAPGITIAPGASTTLVVAYANNDASRVDPLNVLIRHDGAGALTTVPVEVIAVP